LFYFRTWAGSAENFNCVPECGKKNEVFIPLITFGTPSFRGEWPWHTAIFLKEGGRAGDWQYICGGTLISRRTVMTAAHCLTFPESAKVRNVSNFRFDFGRFELENLDDIIQTRQVESIHIHSSYSPFGYDSDIGIVILKESVDTGYHVRPICFPQSVNTAQEEIMLAEGSIGTVIGWGLTENGSVAQNLQTGKLRVVGPVECSQGTKTVGGGRLQIKSTTYCAAPGQNGDSDKIVNVCSGDSGGK
jgi:secreted trypsin-like serine protease